MSCTSCCICQLPTWMRSEVPPNPGCKDCLGQGLNPWTGIFWLVEINCQWQRQSDFTFCCLCFSYIFFWSQPDISWFGCCSCFCFKWMYFPLHFKETENNIKIALLALNGFQNELQHKLGTFAANRFPTDALTIYLALFYAKSFRQPSQCNRIFHLLPAKSNPRKEKHLNWKSCWAEKENANDMRIISAHTGSTFLEGNASTWMREHVEGIGWGPRILCLRALGRPLGPLIREMYIWSL